MKCSAFTLTEMLVSTLVIGIIASLLLPVFNRAKNKVKSLECLSAQRNFFVNLNMLSIESHPNFNYSENSSAYTSFSEEVKLLSGKITPDSQLGHLGVYNSKNLTCPFGSNNKMVYPTLITFTAQEYVVRTDQEKHNGYVTANRFYDSRSLDPKFKEERKRVIYDQVNANLPKLANLNKVFGSIGEKGNRIVEFNNFILHPEKRLTGYYATFRDGSQKWVHDNGHGAALISAP